MNAQILVVEDDELLRDGLSELLSGEGYCADSCSSCEEAEKALKVNRYDLIILDVMLPDGSGYDLCRKLREAGVGSPVLFLTACDDEIQIVRGLDCGADDYVTKPFRLLELLSRVRALLRRSEPERCLSHAGVTLLDGSLCAQIDGNKVDLTPTEYHILRIFLLNRSSIVTRGSIIKGIWENGGEYIDNNTLSVHISRLRDKIGAGRIKTVRGVGYRWEEQ